MIDGEGPHPTQDKLKAIRDAPRPKNVTALKSFLGLIMFYSWFMTHHSTVQAPLHQLLKKGTSWRWFKAEEDAFVAAKQLILNLQTLVHYDYTLPLFLSCDASGAVLSHQINGQFQPVAFASCMSRLPLPQTWSPKCENVECYLLVVTHVTSQMIKETQLNPVLSQVYNYVISGWPHVVDPNLLSFKTRRVKQTAWLLMMGYLCYCSSTTPRESVARTA